MRDRGRMAYAFADRAEAGRRLAPLVVDALESTQQGGALEAIVLGLPRGGVPVAAEIARATGLALDILTVRKLGVPWQPELAVGAIGEGGVRVVDSRVKQGAGVSDTELAEVERMERRELDRRSRRYRRGRRPPDLANRVAVVVDDGAATGSTAEAAARVASAMGAERVVVALPVASPGAVERLQEMGAQVVAILVPDDLSAVGQYYEDFSPTPDREVVRLLTSRG